MIKKIFIILLLVPIVIMLSGCNNVFKTETPSLVDKLHEEIEYLDSELIAMLNNLNGITYVNYRVIPSEVKQTDTASNPNTQMNESGSSPNAEQKESLETSGESASSQTDQQNDNSKSSSTEESDTKTYKMEETSSLNINNSIDWNEIKSNIEIVYTAWITIKLDLEELKISEDIINKFSKELNLTILAIKNENKIESMQGLSNMYGILPEFIKNISDDKFKLYTLETKKNTIAVYNCIENSKWEEAKDSINLAKETFKSTNNIENIEEYKKGDIKRVVALLDELSTSLELKDKELALLKYKGLIQELSIL